MNPWQSRALRGVLYSCLGIGIGFCQQSNGTGTLNIVVLDPAGNIERREISVTIVGPNFEKRGKFRERGSFIVPFGTYRVEASTDFTVATPMLVDVTDEAIGVTLGTMRRPIGDRLWFAPTVRGKLVGMPRGDGPVVAQLVNAYSGVLGADLVQSDGRFAVRTLWPGHYTLVFLRGSVKIAERELDVDEVNNGASVEVDVREQSPSKDRPSPPR
jgi:hypothetical protein